MRLKNTVRADRFGKLIANNLYNDFAEHKEYQGPNWKWENFPDFAWRQANVSCFTMFHYNATNIDNLKLICADAAKLEAIELLKSGKHLK